MKKIVQNIRHSLRFRIFFSRTYGKTIIQVNDMEADALLITGDLTTEGFYHEFETALSYINRFESKEQINYTGES